MSARTVMVATEGDVSAAIFHFLDARVGIDQVIVEEPVEALVLLRGRARRLGWRRALAQAAFRVGVMPVLEREGRARRREIVAEHGLDVSPIPADRVVGVSSVNDGEMVELLRRLAPGVVVVAGTRIIGRHVLEATDAVFLNMHAGITPRYRGVHGAYWALASGDAEHCGVTVHVVDPGVDTGDVVAQAVVVPSPRDNFVTYPWLQAAAGLPLLDAAVRDARDGTLVTSAPGGPSRQWFHPGWMEYVWGRIRGPAR